MQGNAGKAREWSSLGRGDSMCKCPMRGGLKNSQKASVTRLRQKEGTGPQMRPERKQMLAHAVPCRKY